MAWFSKGPYEYLLIIPESCHFDLTGVMENADCSKSVTLPVAVGESVRKRRPAKDTDV